VLHQLLLLEVMLQMKLAAAADSSSADHKGLHQLHKR
jgi:hypothetical protein